LQQFLGNETAGALFFSARRHCRFPFPSFLSFPGNRSPYLSPQRAVVLIEPDVLFFFFQKKGTPLSSGLFSLLSQRINEFRLFRPPPSPFLSYLEKARIFPFSLFFSLNVPPVLLCVKGSFNVNLFFHHYKALQGRVFSFFPPLFSTLLTFPWIYDPQNITNRRLLNPLPP